MKRQKLELNWIGKDERVTLEPRILLEDKNLSYCAKGRISSEDIFDNTLIFGDNLLALKALEQAFSGKVKLIYIDPPYNTGQAFEHYDDGVEHSVWLSLMRERFLILRELLSSDGTFFCQLNDDEMAYGKVLLDEVFGRNNFLNQVSVKMKHTAGASGGGEDKRLKKNIEYILIYAKDRDGVSGFQTFNEVYDEEDLFEVIDDMEAEGKSWKYTSVLLDKGKFVEERTITDGAGDPIIIRKYKGLKRTTVSSLVKQGISREEAYLENFNSIFSDTNAQTSIRTRIIDEFKSLDEDEILESEYVPKSGRDKGQSVKHYYISPTIRRVIWLRDTASKKGKKLVKFEKAGTFWEGFPLNNLTKEGGVQFPHGKKPEALIKKILDLATNPGDLVLDSFAGSGTTGAVAHKMKRRWIMIELGEHCQTHIIPRLKRIIDNEDQGGISELVDWKGGGGFRYYRLAPSLLEKDSWGNWVISKEFNSTMLAEAVCKLNGFTYSPSESNFWQHGFSTERDFIYVTTQTLTREQLAKISEEVGESKSLLICCGAFRVNADSFPNLTLKKIPKAVLSRCEWGRDDYSLKISELPLVEPNPEPILQRDKDTPRSKKERRATSTQGQLGLFERGK